MIVKLSVKPINYETQFLINVSKNEIEKKIIKKKVKLFLHINGPTDFLKFNNMFFSKIIF
jgi:hypothetical protein